MAESRRKAPARGRGFLKEYLIIVVGVATALAGEQAVTWAHQRSELTQARAALREEAVDNATSMRIGHLEDRCLLAAGALWEAWAKGAGPKPPNVAVIFPYPTDAVWESVRSDAASLMPQKEKLAYARFYAAAANNRSLAFAQRDLAIHGAGYLALDQLTPAEARAVLQDSQRVQSLLGGKISNARNELALAKAVGAEPKPLPARARQMLEAECAAAGLSLADVEKEA